MKWNESGFRPPLCTYRLNWARRTSWGWWDDWDDTVLQTQDSKFEPWRSEAEHATSRSRRLPAILTFTRGWGRNIFVSFKPPSPGTEPRTVACKAAVLTTTLGPPPEIDIELALGKCLVFAGWGYNVNMAVISSHIRQLYTVLVSCYLQTREVSQVLVYSWITVWEVGPTINQHRFNVSRWLDRRSRLPLSVRL